jgi:hypothetical protein
MGVDMPFTFQARPDAPLFLAVARRSARTYAFGLGAVFLVIALITAVGFHSYVLAAGYTAMGVVFAARMPGYMAEQAVRKNAAKIGLMTGYRFDEQGIHIAAGFQEHFHGWSEVAAVEEWKGQFAVFVGPGFGTVPGRFMTYQLGRRIVTVPTGDLTEQQRTHLRELLHSRGATAVPAPAD